MDWIQTRSDLKTEEKQNHIKVTKHIHKQEKKTHEVNPVKIRDMLHHLTNKKSRSSAEKEKKRIPFKHGLCINSLCCWDSLFWRGSPCRSSHRSIPLIPINSCHWFSSLSFYFRIQEKENPNQEPDRWSFVCLENKRKKKRRQRKKETLSQVSSSSLWFFFFIKRERFKRQGGRW